ncbi:MAG TPA: hypothetical protein VMZ28_09555 [Kofleriaceae bacterium]|nr:hypothetical protein [Kofleriaceae bacterium]
MVISLAASAQIARAQDAGSSGGACYGNGTCNAGLACEAGVCVAPQAGQMGGACYGNGTCNAGMSCDAATQTCVSGGGAPAGTAPVGGGMTPPPTTGTPPPSGGMAPAAAAPAPMGVTADAPPPPPKRWWASGKAGFLMSGSGTSESDFGDLDFDTESGLFVMGGVDAAMGPRLSIGGFLFYASTGIEDGPDAHITTVGGTIKGRFTAGKAEIRPGAAVGYQMMGGEAFDGTDDSKGLGIGGLVEVAFPMTTQADFLGELGFISQPTGGNDDVDLTFGPIFYIVGGVAFGG